jgi:hypothetical protein
LKNELIGKKCCKQKNSSTTNKNAEPHFAEATRGTLRDFDEQYRLNFYENGKPLAVYQATSPDGYAACHAKLPSGGAKCGGDTEAFYFVGFHFLLLTRRK